MKTRSILLEPMKGKPSKPRVPFSRYFGRVFDTGRQTYEVSRRLNAESSSNIANFLSDIYSRLRNVSSISLFLAPFPVNNTLEHYATICRDSDGKKTISFERYDLDFINDSMVGQAIKTNSGGIGFRVDEKKGIANTFSLIANDFKLGKIKVKKTENGNQHILIPLRASDSDRIRGCLIVSGSDLRLKKKLFMLNSLIFLVTSSHFLYSIIKGQLDPLTGLTNRDTILDSLCSMTQRYLRDPTNPLTNFSLIAVDIDNFKEINEFQGHQIGDEKLKGVASILQRSVRGIQFELKGEEQRSSGSANDLVGRFSDKGDEFGAILPATGVTGALKVASRFLNNIRNKLAHSPGKPLACSFGVVDADTVLHILSNPSVNEGIPSIEAELKKIVPDYEHLSTLEKFVEAMRYVAEKARSNAKREGKGRVCYPPRLQPEEIGKLKFITHSS